ncbi:PLD-like domain-containing protein [Filimonas lacunae]|uniref:PLD-like domain-containing protein n=1 Tax=Filimonas lacunae TaxID=477680 RepID=A0A173MIU1_9BACT|nr:helicase-related protein [Filimonas lacunae]BAV07386.1 superfamily II DNA/RNA helicases, SNF2 family [Filimonas lacunae]SIT30573.1 PLD-like domain-containing protein [Filimonas lacunae]
MSTKFFTNENENTLLNKIEGIFKYRNIYFFDALVGYFHASGYFRIRKFIEKSDEIRILVGINIDKMIHQAYQQGLLFDGDIERAQEDFFNQIKKNIQTAEYDQDVERGMTQLIHDIVTKKVLIRIHPKQNIHAKIYIFREKEKHSHGYGAVITGSSNLTEAGLSHNFEFNVELRDNSDIEFAKETFEKLWKESTPVAEEYIERLTKETFLNATFTPYEVYLKFLVEYFGKSIDFDPNSITDLPKGFKRLTYQIDAVNDGYSKMIKHNGFFLADVVGLGKTIVSTLIAKKYFYSNGFPTYRSRTLIIVPPALKENWVETIDKFHLDNVEIITNGSLHRINNPDKYDLVIVDEAHKFRSDTSGMYNDLQKICKSRTKKILPDGSRELKRIILVSATPLNNRPEDIANQVYLFQDSKNSTLEVGNLQQFFRQQIDAYRKLRDEKNLEKVKEGVKHIYDKIRIKIIEPLTVRRTRTDLTIHKQYAQDLIDQGISFPHVQKPEKIFYELEPRLDLLYDKTIRCLSHPTDGLTYNRYRAIGFLKPHRKNKYQKADMISSQLAKIMKTLLVKRIDSSFHAFKQSLERFLNATKAMVRMFDNGKIYIAPNLPVSDYINEGKEEELLDLLLNKSLEDPTIEICEPDDFEPEFIVGLKRDYAILMELNMDWRGVDEDPKLAQFVIYLKEKLFNKKINKEQKLVVFSESKETTAYLELKLKAEIDKRVITVDSKSRKERMPVIRANFDANYPLMEQKNDYDIILSTEVLAEGVNLHRANIIINYDTPWNSTRLMQRIGRVNRIGSKASEIHIFNFFPTTKVNSDIELEKKAIMKLQAFHAALGEDSQIYSPDEETQTFGIFDHAIEEDRDEKLIYLMLLRELREKEPEIFKKVKNMPLRARVGRKSKIIRDSTISFIRDSRRDSFLYVKSNNEIEELTFLETAKQFEAKRDEMAFNLHSLHHKQVQKAVEHFSNTIEEEKARDKKVDITQGPNEKKALAYLDAFLNLSFANSFEKELILEAKEAIRKGKFQNLQRDLNKLQKAVKKTPLNPVLLLEQVMGILRSYPLERTQEDIIPEVAPSILIKNLNPDIIITESFTV